MASSDSSSDSERQQSRTLRETAGVSRSGFMKRKGTWRNAWREYFYCLDTGCLVEYSKPGSTRPKKFYSLSQFTVKLADKLVGADNTFGLFSLTLSRQPIYFMCPNAESLHAWVSALGKWCALPNDSEDDKLLEAFNDGVIVASSDGTITATNQAFLDLFGYHKSDLIGRNVTDLMESQYAVHHAAYMKRYLDVGHGSFIGQAREYNVRDASGRFVPAEISLGEMTKGSDKTFIGRFRRIDRGADVKPTLHLRRDSSSGSMTEENEGAVDASVVSTLTSIVRGALSSTEEQIITAVYGELKSLKTQLETERKKTSKQARTIRKLKSLRVAKSSSAAGTAAAAAAAGGASAGGVPSSQSTSGVPVSDSSSSIGPGRDGLLVVDPAEPIIGQRLASTGGSGAGVYCATVDGWSCVVKELIIKDLPPQQLRLFEFEMDTLEHLPLHRNLARYLFHVKTATKYQLFMTRYDSTLGHVVRTRTAEKKPFSKHEIVRFLIDITRGLEVLHKHEIIHRDIKTDNIFVEYGRTGDVERLVIGDFDAAKRIALHGQAQTVIGTPGYMAPEIMTDTRYGYPADIWSVGMVLYELLALQRPFENNPMGAMTILISKISPTLDPALVAPHLTSLISIFDKCVSYDPVSRPTVAELNRMMVDEFLLCG